MLPILFFNDTATTEIYTLSLHDALPILMGLGKRRPPAMKKRNDPVLIVVRHAHRNKSQGHAVDNGISAKGRKRSEEHTSELQSRQYLVCRLLLEKKKKPGQLHRSEAHTT